MSKRRLCNLAAALAVAAVPSIVLTCCRAGPGQSLEDQSINDAQERDVDCSSVQCGNCVLHARCLQPALPHGLISCNDKRNAITSYEPTVGCVAFMDVGPYCHAGYVYDVQGTGTNAIISLDEGNLRAGVCERDRSGTAADLKIMGYFCP